jgi:hypothetical protein
MNPKTKKPGREAVIDDGATPSRRTPADRRPLARSNNKDEAALETYEQPPQRGSGDDVRSELSRQPRGERTARDEP